MARPITPCLTGTPLSAPSLAGGAKGHDILGWFEARTGRFAAFFRSTAMADTDLFFSRTGMDRAKVQETVDTALKGSDDGELFLEYSQSESFSYDDGRLKAASFDPSTGFGLC